MYRLKSKQYLLIILCLCVSIFGLDYINKGLHYAFNELSSVKAYHLFPSCQTGTHGGSSAPYYVCNSYCSNPTDHFNYYSPTARNYCGNDTNPPVFLDQFLNGDNIATQDPDVTVAGSNFITITFEDTDNAETFDDCSLGGNVTSVEIRDGNDAVMFSTGLGTLTESASTTGTGTETCQWFGDFNVAAGTVTTSAYIYAVVEDNPAVGGPNQQTYDGSGVNEEFDFNVPAASSSVPEFSDYLLLFVIAILGWYIFVFSKKQRHGSSLA